MRVDRELKAWERAGWSREPRNGREWRLLRAGLPQPKEVKRWRNKYKCRRCAGTLYKVHIVQSQSKRKCVKCDYKTGRDYYRANKERSKKAARKHTLSERAKTPIFMDGAYSGSMTWARAHMNRMPEYTQQGIIVVEAYGEPAFAIVSLEDARKLL